MSANQDTLFSEGDGPTSPNRYIREYLCLRSEIFRELSRVRVEGWNKQSGDKYFENQRRTADKADTRTSRAFFNIMQKIGNEMHKSTGAMSLIENGRILDLCMAPGGYSAAALKVNPDASVSGATLPEQHGGHKLLVKDGFNGAFVRVWKGDITSLVGDMGIDKGDVPEEHPGFGKFQKDEVWAGEQFDLVFCDGQFLRPHSRNMAEYRQRHEATRLICSQLLIAIRHVKAGGSMVMLLHNIERWNTVLTLRSFDRFANIALFKPLAAHKSRSSFYLVAKNIQPDHKEALAAIQDWTKSWKDATFCALTGEGGEDASPDHENKHMVLGPQVTEVMGDFGERLIALGENTWKIQKEAIEQSSWFRKAKTEETTKASITNGLTSLPSKIEKGLMISE